MSDDLERLRMRRSTRGLDYRGEFGAWMPSDRLAPIMLAAYRGTPDDEGETLEDTIAVIDAGIAGEWGDWVEEASFVALNASEPVGAVMMAMTGERPFISFVFTHPDHAGTGVATRLIGRACAALAARGDETVDLWVNPASERAIRLYRHLGFEPV
jgi:ribosomal protein S18 acetylase RimI-like enzyme